MTPRKVTANINLTLDGHYTGPNGDLSAITRYATTETARRHLTRIHQGVTTALLGRVNAEGFLGFWPTVATDPTANPHDRAYATWLVNTEKIILSTTRTDAPWPNSRIANTPTPTLINTLTTTGTGDILVNCSPTITKSLLTHNLLDRLHLMITPELTGTGHRLFDTPLPPTSWTLTHHETGPLGELTLTYDRHP